MVQQNMAYRQNFLENGEICDLSLIMKLTISYYNL